jgi:hypothetical protein
MGEAFDIFRFGEGVALSGPFSCLASWIGASGDGTKSRSYSVA